MIEKTEGIVLTHTRYGESSAIVRIYTKLFGMQSYMVNGLFNKKKKSNIHLLQPLNILNMEAYHHAGKDLQRIKEFKIATPLLNLPFSQSRRAQAFLITEMLARILRSEESSESLFNFLVKSIKFLDSENGGMENYHIYFLLMLTKQLGFHPNNNYSDINCWFDLMEGCFVSVEPPHPHYLNIENSRLFMNMFSINEQNITSVATNISQRRILLEALVMFFELHQPGIGKIRSLSVLNNLFNY